MMRRTLTALTLNCLFWLSAATVHAVTQIEPSEAQADTARELVEQLEKRHYAKLHYDENLSTAHLENYIDSLDGGKMFFTQADVAEFRKYAATTENDFSSGNLGVGFMIFNRFAERLEARLTRVVETLPERYAAMDFTVDEDFVINGEKRTWAMDSDELEERWRKHLKNQALSLRLADKDEEDIASVLSKRYQRQLKRVAQYNAQDVFQVYANALTELYDPHSNYLSPRRSENFNINMSLSLEGIGAVLQSDDDYTKVARIVAAGPADKQGDLKPSDRIVAVGQGEEGPMEDVIGWRLDEVVDLIRGPKDSTVRLSVMPGTPGAATEERKTIKIVRNTVKLEEQSAQKRVLELPAGDDTIKVGVIDIPAFYIDFDAMRRGDDDYKSTTRDVGRLLEELQTEGVDGVIIDLRNNGGGSLQEANELTGLFIEYGPTVQIRHSSRRVWRDGKRLRSAYYEGPLVVMINRLSASASEIFAGAIQDYERGIIVGDRSFGKGTVQTMVPLKEGQLKVTESKFYRISGDSTQHRGVVPDITFPSMFNAEEIGESSLDHALAWDQINPVRHRRYGDLDAVIPELAALFDERKKDNAELNYLVEQVSLANDDSDVDSVSLNEAVRRARRETRMSKALAIENRRRSARGEEPLASLDDDDRGEEDENSSDGLAAADADPDENKDEVDDVLLTEAGHILVDTLLMREPSYAVNAKKKD
ncbi:carboxy terminal-processing peptidase [Chromatocurvus halotolerans]|uniref:Carboxyl-terminal processing protease n=1 Tax=Chromatocurvus halotolerans TaxID=1132028 RepID=A0A4R2L2W4_9GAMM|nr:carboxy terminal-processing peptidase [Chromatocurvus halotolerans]TCO78249.1 carboxyl-terminal processing protease [Chromatocurvus halotolerans]